MDLLADRFGELALGFNVIPFSIIPQRMLQLQSSIWNDGISNQRDNDEPRRRDAGRGTSDDNIGAVACGVIADLDIDPACGAA